MPLLNLCRDPLLRRKCWKQGVDVCGWRRGTCQVCTGSSFLRTKRQLQANLAALHATGSKMHNNMSACTHTQRERESVCVCVCVCV